MLRVLLFDERQAIEDEETAASRILQNRIAAQPELGKAKDAEVKRLDVPGLSTPSCSQSC